MLNVTANVATTLKGRTSKERVIMMVVYIKEPTIT